MIEKNPKYFYSSADFQQLLFLEKHVETIKSELLNLIASDRELWLTTFPDYVDSGETDAWQVFSFLFFQMKNSSSGLMCPKTSEIIQQIPELISCDFSRLKKKTHLLPHKGYSKMVLRCHLPLVIPKHNTCRLRVENETQHWEEGKLLIFDDSYEHEAWNDSDEDRFVLLFDIPNPLWAYSAEEISRYKIEHLDDPFLLQFATKEEWMIAFEHRQLPSDRITFQHID